MTEPCATLLQSRFKVGFCLQQILKGLSCTLEGYFFEFHKSYREKQQRAKLKSQRQVTTLLRRVGDH